MTCFHTLSADRFFVLRPASRSLPIPDGTSEVVTMLAESSIEKSSLLTEPLTGDEMLKLSFADNTSQDPFNEAFGEKESVIEGISDGFPKKSEMNAYSEAALSVNATDTDRNRASVETIYHIFSQDQSFLFNHLAGNRTRSL